MVKKVQKSVYVVIERPLDVNSAYVFVASTLQFPIGPLEILIHDDVENYVYKNGVLMQKDTNKVIDAGLIKLLVLPNQNQEPLFVVKGKDPKTKKQRTYQPLCSKCLRLQKKIPCTHSEKERAIEVTTTVDFLLWALSIKNVTIFKILEVWSFKEKAYVMKKFLELMIDFKDKQRSQLKTNQQITAVLFWKTFDETIQKYPKIVY